MSRKNLNKSKYRDDAPDAPPKPPRPWELKAVFFVLRAIAVFFFMAYLFMTSYSVYSWTWATWVRSRPMNDVVFAADKYLNKKNDPQKLTSWLNVRPAAEHDKIIELLDPYTSKMGPDIFFMFSRWMSEENKQDDARFWWMLGNFRLRFDLMRCGGQDAIQKINEIMNIYAGKEYDRLFKDQPDEMLKNMKKVMDFDAKYPARNNPANFCTLIWQTSSVDTSTFRILPEYQWASVRAGLRASSQKYIDAHKQEPDKKDATPVKPDGAEKKPSPQKPQLKKSGASNK